MSCSRRLEKKQEKPSTAYFQLPLHRSTCKPFTLQEKHIGKFSITDLRSAYKFSIKSKISFIRVVQNLLQDALNEVEPWHLGNPVKK